MIEFGFSYVGLIYMVMLFVPNIIWARYKPADYDRYVVNENRVLLLFERTGEVVTLMCSLIFADFNIRSVTVWSVWLLVSFLLMVLYELYWISYFRSPRRMADMYKSYAGFPVAGASLPCVAFFCLGIYGINIFLIISSIILSIGHIGIHLMHRNEVCGKPQVNVIRRILRVLLIIIMVILILPVIIAIAGRNINWIRSNIDTSKGINESSFVEIGGQEQYILIRGRDTSNPVILYLHGGPAGPDTAISPVFTDPLIDDYTVVCWDQRGCGRTYYRNEAEDPWNETADLDRAISDTDELVDLLCDRFDKDKVILMCHSYGTIVGTRYVQEHSDKVSSYIGIGQFVNSYRSDMLSYADAYAKATANGEDTSLLEKAYDTYMNADSLQDYLVLRNITYPYHPPKNNASSILLAIFSPYTGVDDVRWVLEQSDLDRYRKLGQKLFDATFSYDIYDCGLEYDVPMFFISGEIDYICNTELSKTFSEDITAPVSRFVTIPGGGHTPHYETPELFGEAVKELLNSTLM